MSFDPFNCFLKIQKSIGTPIPKVGAHLGVCGFIPSHSPTLGNMNYDPRLHFWPAPLQAIALVMSLRLRLWQVISLKCTKTIFFNNDFNVNVFMYQFENFIMLGK
jgi:hypothetical protein